MSNVVTKDNKNSYTEIVVSEIKELINQSRKNVARQVNYEILATYWKIGEVIVKYE